MKSVERTEGQRKPSRHFLLAGLLFMLYLWLNVATLHHYGVTQDEPEHWFFGDRYLQFFLTLDRRALDFSGAPGSVVQTWPVGPTLAALTAKVFSEGLNLVDRNDGHHLASIFLFGLLLSSLFLFLAVHAGSATAILSCVALAMQPRIWGEAHNNAQDIPHLVFFSLTILSLLHGLITQRARWLLASAICWGFALGSKINAVSLPVVIAPILLPRLWDQRRHPASISRLLAAYPVIAISVVFLAWPYLWQSPFDRLSRFWAYLISWGYTGPRVWQATPALNVLVTTPVPILAFALVGITASAWTGKPLGRRVIMTLLMWLVVPIARASLPGALNYNVIRRFMEFSPPLAMFAGIGGVFLTEWITRKRWLRRRWAWGIVMVVLLTFFTPVLALWQYFPYESSYYNGLVGGLGGAQALRLKDAVDYTLTSYRKGINWLNVHADAGARLLVGHGPHLPVLSYYPIRKDLTLAHHLWMDQLVAGGRTLYLMYVPTVVLDMDILTYNICLAEAFLRPEYEIRRDGGIILRIYKLTAESHLAVVRDAFPPPQGFSATNTGRSVTLRWQPAPLGDVVGYILYYGRSPGQYEGAVCFRGTRTQWEFISYESFGTYYLSLSFLTRRIQESERTPDIRMEFFD